MRLRRGAFCGGKDTQGQAVFEASQSWTVPGGVTLISIVCVGGGLNPVTSVTVAGVAVCKTTTFAITGDGGGLGGVGGSPAGTADPVREGGGGGAGGYTGAGGNGVGVNVASGAGSGGGGSGGSAQFIPGTGYIGQGGGGVGLLGEGASGASVTSVPGKGGSGGNDGNAYIGGKYGGGRAGAGSGGAGTRGGHLAWKNNVAVSPGQVITIVVGADNGGVRIMWGGGRSYPNNAGDV